MASTINVFARGLRNPDTDALTRSGATYFKGDILEIITAAINFADCADDETLSSVITDATGVAIGDCVIGVSASAANTDPVHDAGLILSAKVSDANEITLMVQNDSGGAINAGSQTFRILVVKAA